jgi:hypothetical protein
MVNDAAQTDCVATPTGYRDAGWLRNVGSATTGAVAVIAANLASGPSEMR